MNKEETFPAEIISGNRITIPWCVRGLLKLSIGDLVRITIEKVKDAKGVKK